MKHTYYSLADVHGKLMNNGLGGVPDAFMSSRAMAEERLKSYAPGIWHVVKVHVEAEAV